jgi:hypothetical protein
VAIFETTLNQQNVSNSFIEMENDPQERAAWPHGFTAPMVAHSINTSQGDKTVVYVAGSSIYLFGVDAATAKVIWKCDFEIHIAIKDQTM